MNNAILFLQICISSMMTLFLLWAVSLGAATLLGCKINEMKLRKNMILLGWMGLLIGSTMFACMFTMLLTGNLEFQSVIMDVPWFSVGNYHYELSLLLSFSSCLYACLASFLFICIATFSGNYLHRDAHYQRFMMQMGFTQLGVLIICFAKSGDLTFFGWEMVGLSSVLLIGFFQNHKQAARQSLRAMINYKFADAFLIMGMLLMQFRHGHSNFFPALEIANGNATDYWIGALLILGSLGKAGQFPFHTWLARAMEGPTPSSALFYGALSVHLGPLLLIKAFSYWYFSPELRLLVAITGLTTATLCTLTGRTQGNIKGQLAFAVMSQIGLIYVELALGLKWLAMIHILGHSLLRTWQYLRSASLLRDVSEYKIIYDLVKARGNREKNNGFSLNWNKRLYVHAVQGFHFDGIYRQLLVKPLTKISKLISFAEVTP